jgi:hypothetical protein
MYEITVFLWFTLPYLLMFICLCLVTLVAYLFTQASEYRRGYRKGRRAVAKLAFERGKVAGRAEGEAAGRQAEHLEHQNFVLCPEPGCDKAIHVPCHVVIDGEPDHQEIRAEVDQTELVMHMYEHTGKLPPQAPDVPHEGGHQ